MTSPRGNTLLSQPQSNNADAQNTSRIGRRDDVSDHLLQDLVESHSRKAFIALFNHYAPKIKAFMVKGGFPLAQADELAQEVMLSIWKAYKNYDAKQASANTWVFTIARNKRIDALRKNSKPMPEPHDFEVMQPVEKTPEDTVHHNEIADKIKIILETLPPEQSELITLSYYNNMTHSDIAAATNLPLGTIKSRLRLALGKLRKELTLSEDER